MLQDKTVASLDNIEDFEFIDFPDLFDDCCDFLQGTSLISYHLFLNCFGASWFILIFTHHFNLVNANHSRDSMCVGKVVAKKSNRNGMTGTKSKQRSRSPKSRADTSCASSSQVIPSRSMKLFVFPDFDKCDALLYFPTTMSRHLNSGDFDAFTRLVNSHCHKNCDFVLPVFSKTPSRFSSARFLDLFQLMNELHPDSVMCCYSTKVVENEIQARLYFKLTDSIVLNDAMSRTVTDPVFAGILMRERNEKFREELQVYQKSEHEQRQISELLESGEDLTVYGQVDLGLQFDDTTKKVTGLKFFAKFTSLSHVDKPKFLAYKRI